MSLQIVYFIHILLMLFANINCDRKVGFFKHLDILPFHL